VNLHGAKYLAPLIIALALVLAVPTTIASADSASNAEYTERTTLVVVPVRDSTVKPKVASMPREYRMAKSKDAKDMLGFEPSLYRGKWYTTKAEKHRKCIMNRESSFSYHAANSVSSARGAYQFLDNSWRSGLVHMFVKESKKTEDGLVKEAKKLFDKPIHKWNRYWQDRAFFTAWRFGEGKHHWYHGSIRCF